VRNFFSDNVNSILGAISIHLLVVIAFLWFKLGEMDEIQKEEQVLIEFNEEMLPPEEEKQAESEKLVGEEVGSLDRQTLHSIASNVASKMDKEISTSEYEKQVLQELGISSLKAPGGELEKNALKEDENAIKQREQPERETEKDFDVPNMIRKDNTTVSYFLEGRWHKHIYIPTYKCQGGGTVMMDIVINQSGSVISAMIQENKSTADPCLREEAYRSAMSAVFNADPKSSSKQLGTMSYVFLPQ
jgi:hypothetical protein